MSGHSKWAKTHRQKAVSDAKKGAIFTRLGNLITIAAKEGGADQEANFKLRLAVDKAKAANMPKDNIERAISRGAGTGGDGSALEEVVYEIFGPAGSNFMVEGITDNKNRTISDIKTALNKTSGQLGNSGSVSWMFERLGVIMIDKENLPNENEEDFELELIDWGAEEIVKNDDGWEIRTATNQVQTVEEKLKEKNIAISESGLSYIPKEYLEITDQENQQKIEKLFSALEDCDDITNVYTNANW